MIIAPSRPFYITYDYIDIFLTIQVMFLMYQYTRRAIIKFLRLHVPRVLLRGANPTVEDFVGN